MRWIPEEERQSLGEVTKTLEDVAFEEFCSQLTGLLGNYLNSTLVADATLRAERAVCALASVTDDVNKRAKGATLLN